MAEKVVVRIDKGILRTFKGLLKDQLPEGTGARVDEMNEADVARLAANLSIIWTREYPELTGVFFMKYAELIA